LPGRQDGHAARLQIIKAANNQGCESLSNKAGRRISAGLLAFSDPTTNECERSDRYVAAQGTGAMQTLFISFLFGATCTMVLWAAGSAAMMRDQMMQRYRDFSPSEEL
jgi:hypothetical protein